MEMRDAAREAYAISLRAVFIFGALATLGAFIVRLGVSYFFPLWVMGQN